ncbi:MAG TPA: glycosyltransferase family 2 protein [Deltaproteobacteria bacterium]|nr:glycosyltransferase family 2 protein [Deltaproteobacteria bacterium]
MGREPELSIAVPLYNEEENIERVIGELTERLDKEGVDYELVLVNNGSRDATPSLIERMASENERIRPVHLRENQGYGGGILAGLRLCRGRWVGYMWGDDQVVADDVLRVFRELRDGRLDLCKARRVERHDGLQRRLITKTYNAVFPLFFKVSTTDVNGCPKLMRREVFEALRIRSTDWFIDAEIMIKAERRGLAVGEVPVVFHERKKGSSSVNYRTVLEFIANMFRHRFNGFFDE